VIGYFVGARADFRPLLTIDERGRSLVTRTHDLYWLEDGRSWCFPAGRTTDGASIPRVLWTLIGHPLEGLFLRPSIAHDDLYRSGAVSRGKADAMFRRQLLSEGVEPWRAAAMYAGVRIGGWLAWRRYRRGNA
jgi:hypothetical protein